MTEYLSQFGISNGREAGNIVKGAASNKCALATGTKIEP
jgi:hypothetical protein